MAKHYLHPLPYGRFYCGPSAIASFTGLHPKDDLRERINVARGFRESQGVIGMSNRLVVNVLNDLCVRNSGFYEPSKLNQTVRQFAEENKDRSFIVNVRGHYIAVSNGYCQDSKSGGVYRADLFTGAKCKVLRVCEIFTLTEKVEENV